MDAALDAAPEVRTPALILFGAKDELITEKPMKAMLNRLPEDAAERHAIIRYEQGYHMILRDLQAERVWRDVVDWIEARIAATADRIAQ
jgi:acylglycerol lipase